MVKQSAREFVNKEVLPIIEKHAQDQTFPHDLISKMGSLGFFGPTLPEKYGCSNLSATSYGLLMYELERGDSGIRSVASVQSSLVMWPIFQYGNDRQKDYWLPLLASGEKVGCFGLTEADFGSNPSGMLTKAVKQSNGKWLINGTKMWITNGSISDVAVVWAQTEQGV
ncbi:MAG: acyl-CoA dehydrogenase family protein, partial [Holophagaceae bacterium]